MDYTQMLVSFTLNTLDDWGGKGEFWLCDDVLKFYDEDDFFRVSYIIEEEVDMDKFFKVVEILGIDIQ